MGAPIQIAAAEWQAMKQRLLAAMPELEDDESTLLDTLEGCTDLHGQIAAMIRAAKKAEAFAAGTGEQIKALQDRKSLLVARANKLKQTALHYMEDAGIKRIEEPDMTITRKATPPGVQVTDVDSLPDEFCRFKREANKTSLKAALQAGEEIPGAHLTNGGSAVQVKI